MNATIKATITITRSSHPEFEFFASTIVKGRQLSVRTHTYEEAYEWAETVMRQGLAYGVAFSLVVDI
jgi:hypothetical protein